VALRWGAFCRLESTDGAGLTATAADPAAGVWLGLLSGDLARVTHGKLEVFPFRQSSVSTPDSMVNDLLVEPDGSAMGATSFGVIAWHKGEVQTMTVSNGLPCNEVFALLTDNHEDLWLNARCGLIRISRAELQRWWRDPTAVLILRVLDSADGALAAWAPFNSAAKSADGRLWFANNEGSMRMVDPNRLALNPFPPPVHFEEIVADRRSHMESGPIVLPPLTRDLAVSYTALSFTAPQKVRFRYKLENHDSAWQDAGTRRQAFYTDLSPGHYRFRVIACNNEGVWNEVGDTRDFFVLPAWYQTLWFRMSMIIATVFLLWFAHRVRVRQVADAITMRSEERLAERTRIARDLHDTLLQTIQATKLISEDALEKRNNPEEMGRSVERILEWLKRAAHEGRAALNSLRTSTTMTNDLANAMELALHEDFVPDFMETRFAVTGEAREMHPIVRDEIYRIAYEAIRNACLHSSAAELFVDLKYSRDLTLQVRDNGVGMTQKMSAEGKPEHFGLAGMRERAQRIGAHLQIISQPEVGTTITLQVKGSVAFIAEAGKHRE
jgi:signal transduction histidine kinase